MPKLVGTMCRRSADARGPPWVSTHLSGKKGDGSFGHRARAARSQRYVAPMGGGGTRRRAGVGTCTPLSGWPLQSGLRIKSGTIACNLFSYSSLRSSCPFYIRGQRAKRLQAQHLLVLARCAGLRRTCLWVSVSGLHAWRSVAMLAWPSSVANPIGAPTASASALAMWGGRSSWVCRGRSRRRRRRPPPHITRRFAENEPPYPLNASLPGGGCWDRVNPSCATH